MGKIKPGADNGGFSGSLTQRIVKALGVFTGVQSAGMLCSVIRAKLIAMWIGPAGVGLNALLTNALDVLSQLSQAGIRVSAVRSIAATDDGRERTGLITALLRWALWLGSGGAVLTMLLSPLLSLLTFGDYSYSWMFVVLAVAVLASALSVGRSAALQGIGELKRLATLTVTAVIISTLLAIPLFYFFRLKSIVWVVTLFAVVQAAVFYIDPGHRGSHRSDLSHRQCFRIGMPFIRLGLVLTMSNALTMVSNFVITVFLNRYASTDEVGIFQAGFAIINNYMGILVSALTVEYFPRLSANIANRRRSEVLVSHQLMILMSLLVPGVIVFLIFSRQIVWLLYSADFMDAVPYLTFAVGGGVLRMVSSCMALCMLAAADSRAYMLTELGSAFTGLVLAIGGYMLAGIAGMGVAYLLWYALYTVAVWAIYRFRYRMRVRSRALRIIMPGLALIAAAQIIAACM